MTFSIEIQSLKKLEKELINRIASNYEASAEWMKQSPE
jgi:hypothetical protein